MLIIILLIYSIVIPTYFSIDVFILNKLRKCTQKVYMALIVYSLYDLRKIVHSNIT